MFKYQGAAADPGTVWPAKQDESWIWITDKLRLMVLLHPGAQTFHICPTPNLTGNLHTHKLIDYFFSDSSATATLLPFPLLVHQRGNFYWPQQLDFHTEKPLWPAEDILDSWSAPAPPGFIPIVNMEHKAMNGPHKNIKVATPNSFKSNHQNHENHPVHLSGLWESR